MNITLTGASGFIGGTLIAKLKSEGHRLHVLGRNAPRAEGVEFSKWDASSDQMPPTAAIADSDAIIHLAGEPVAQRWTDEVKRGIRASRVNGTQRLVEAIAAVEKGRRPKVLVAASAIGYYGDRGDEIVDETSRPGIGFLSEVCVEWEAAAQSAASLGLRVVCVRIGVVLGHGGGALGKMLPIFKTGAGGRIGTGHQWMSWIHLEDLIGVVLLGLNNPGVNGPMNGTAPNPVTNGDFTHALGEAIHRPAVIPVPEFGLKIMFGEMAQVLLTGQRVLPEVAVRAGYSFKYPELRPALAAAIR